MRADRAAAPGAALGFADAAASGRQPAVDVGTGLTSGDVARGARRTSRARRRVRTRGDPPSRRWSDPTRPVLASPMITTADECYPRARCTSRAFGMSGRLRVTTFAGGADMKIVSEMLGALDDRDHRRLLHQRAARGRAPGRGIRGRHRAAQPPTERRSRCQSRCTHFAPIWGRRGARGDLVARKHAGQTGGPRGTRTHNPRIKRPPETAYPALYLRFLPQPRPHDVPRPTSVDFISRHV